MPTSGEHASLPELAEREHSVSQVCALCDGLYPLLGFSEHLKNCPALKRNTSQRRVRVAPLDPPKVRPAPRPHNECPYCKYVVEKHFERHKRNCRPTTFPVAVAQSRPLTRNSEQSTIGDTDRISTRLVQCPKCKALNPPGIADQHECSGGKSPFNAVNKLPFEILGLGPLMEAIEDFTRTHPAHAHGFDDEEELLRLEKVDSMGPVKNRYIGLKAWKGYCAFEFQNSTKAVVERPRTGNATYILSGDWEMMLHHTRAELRSEFRHLSTRVIHTPGWEIRGSEWERRVRRAVFQPEQRRVARPSPNAN